MCCIVQYYSLVRTSRRVVARRQLWKENSFDLLLRILLVKRQVQLEHVNPGLAEQPEIRRFGVLRHQLVDLIHGDAALGSRILVWTFAGASAWFNWVHAPRGDMHAGAPQFFAGMSLSDYLRRELEAAAERLTPGELRERLAALEPVRVRQRPAAAVRAERDSR